MSAMDHSPLNRGDATDDMRLVSRIRAGDQQAMSELYDRYAKVVYAVVISRHRAIDRLRQRRPETDIEDCVIAGGPDIRDETERKLVIDKVRAVVQEMNPDQRKALEMAFFEGLTHTEIAEKTGEPLGTVKTRIRSGLQFLRAKFAG